MACISRSRAEGMGEVYMITTGLGWSNPEMQRWYLTLDEAETSARAYVKQNEGQVAIVKQRFGRNQDHIANVCLDGTGRIWTDVQSMEAASLL